MTCGNLIQSVSLNYTEKRWTSFKRLELDRIPNTIKSTDLRENRRDFTKLNSSCKSLVYNRNSTYIS